MSQSDERWRDYFSRWSGRAGDPLEPAVASPEGDGAVPEPTLTTDAGRPTPTVSRPPPGTRVRVVGCGQCGSQIASSFVHLGPPSYVPGDSQDIYPFRAVAFDTSDVIADILATHWGWDQRDDVFVLPMPPIEYIKTALLGGRLGVDPAPAGLDVGDQNVGVGGLPYLGMLAAENSLIGPAAAGSARPSLAARIRDRLTAGDFTSGVLLTCNSLTGGTGNGMSPVVSRWLKDDVEFVSDLSLNLSILPSQSEIREAHYPRSALAGLHAMLAGEPSAGGMLDTVIVADNDSLARYDRAANGNYRTFNKMLRDMIAPLLMASMGRYSVPELSSTLDLADIKRWTRSRAGFGPPEISTIGYATLPLKAFEAGRFSSARSRRQRVRDGLTRLAELATSQYALGGDEAPLPKVGGVATLFGPPRFFERVLNMDTGHVDFLSDLLKEKAGIDRFRKADCLQFDTPKLDYVGVSILVSGISSTRLQNVLETALGSGDSLAEWDPNETVAQNIRGISPVTVEELMVGEIREVLQLS